MKPIRFHPEAEAEMILAASWYESQQADLGKRFLTSVQDTLNKIELNPDLYPVVEADVRRCLTKTFPFGVLKRMSPTVGSLTYSPASCIVPLYRKEGLA